MYIGEVFHIQNVMNAFLVNAFWSGSNLGFNPGFEAFLRSGKLTHGGIDIMDSYAIKKLSVADSSR
jgi:hypothetical protein